MSEKWYVLQAVPGREREAAELFERKISRKLWTHCRILYKQQLFRIHGGYVLGRREMFPGYLFVKTDRPEALAYELEKARDFPQAVGVCIDGCGTVDNRSEGLGADFRPDGCSRISITPVEQGDLAFLQNVCGTELGHDMALSTVEVDGGGQVKSARGALSAYRHQIKKQRLNKRFVIASIPLFNRQAEVLFGIRLAGDEIRTKP